MIAVVVVWALTLWFGGGIQRQPAPPVVVAPAAVPSDCALVSGTYKVIGISDGDTADVLKDGKKFRLRLNGIDTPEKGQPFGNNAKQALSDRIGGKEVRVVVHETDRYGRALADLYDDTGDVNLWMVSQGMAWHYKAYSDNAQLAAAERQAKSDQRGLWSDRRAVAPWNWRKLSVAERDMYR